jgi:hypothetical protein
MGTYLWSYAVDLARLRQVFGSKDRALARRTIKNARVEDNASWFADEIEAGAPPLDRAISEIIDGKLTAKKYAFQYVYALERLCGTIGKCVGDELKVGGWIEEHLDPLLDKVKAKDFCHLMHLHAAALPMRIPAAKDFPFCSSMTVDEVNRAHGAFKRLELRLKTEPLDREMKEGIDYVMNEMRERLGGATRRRSGLVNFLY